jgi:hypothetical protein
MLFSARRVVHVRTTSALEGAAKLSFGDQLLKRLGLGSGFVASGSGGDNSANTVDLVGTNSIPVAFAPAFVVIATKQAANGQVKYEIASVNEEVVAEKIRFARQSQGGSFTRLAAEEPAPAHSRRHRTRIVEEAERPVPRMRRHSQTATREDRVPRVPEALNVRKHILQDALTGGHAVSAVGF